MHLKLFIFTFFNVCLLFKPQQDADMMHVVLHKPFYPFTMFWPTDDVFNNLPEARKTWLYTEEHRDKLQAYLKSHIVRDQKVRNSHGYC